MPPRGHSSSSHSSSPRSSGSSFRSSSSRSSGSFSRGPSSHSGSSHSSSPRNYGKPSSGGFSFQMPSSARNKPASSHGPSAHSTSSKNSRPAVPAAPARPREPAWRPRVNQPTGFVTATHQRPTYYYGRRHSYAYYPLAWVDLSTGTSYEKGYYDENGQRYDTVTFEEDGRYKNVLCHCPYCEQDMVLDLSAGDVEEHSLKCPHCGAPMEIRSELDAILSESAEEESAAAGSPSPAKKKGGRGTLWIVVAMVIMVLAIARSTRRHLTAPEPDIENPLQPITVDQDSDFGPGFAYGEPIYLEKQADGYHVVTDVLRADKILEYDADADSYYDEESDCWLWYNTDMDPAIWQYWYEGISSDYESGWMEHAADGWSIEESAGRWIPLPGRYDGERLWYIS